MGEILFYKYELLRLIGSGSTGRVYLAWDMHLERLVAVKESRADLPSKELELLKELEHPGLPGVYDCIRQEENIFLVMEYVEGMTLRQYLDRYGRVEEAQAVRWAMDLCGILAYLHGRCPAVVYRDLKPENIMVRPDGGLKLIDLGAAIHCAFGEEREGFCAGTVGYCPPEQWKEPRGNVAFDIYGLGAVLHEMLTGVNPTQPPYLRRPVGEYEVAYRGALEKIIETCTAKEPSDRFSSMEQLRDALGSYQELDMYKRIFQALKAFLVVCAAGVTALSLFIPLARGVPRSQILFPFLLKPSVFLIITWLLYHVLFKYPKVKYKRSSLRRQEKNIWLTEKKFRGLLSFLLLVFGGIWPLAFSNMLLPSVYASEEPLKLWVEMRDEMGRKMLLKEGAVYVTDDRVRFELPADRLPAQELSMQLVAVGEDGNVYSSRIFLILAQSREDGKGIEQEEG